MNGKIMVTYKILCDTDINKEIPVQELLENDKIFRAIKTEYAKGTRNTTLSCNEDAVLKIETVKKVHTFEVSKNDFSDLLVLAEEDAKNKKLLKKDCDRVKLVDIETMS